MPENEIDIQQSYKDYIAFKNKQRAEGKTKPITTRYEPPKDQTLEEAVKELDDLIEDKFGFVAPDIYSRWQGVRRCGDIEKVQEFIRDFTHYCSHPLNCA